MPPPLDPARLYDIKKALDYYQYEVEIEDLKANDFKWLLEFVGALLKYVEYQKGIIFEQTDSLRELGVSMDTLKKEVGTFMRNRKASEIEGGEVRSKRVKDVYSSADNRFLVLAWEMTNLDKADLIILYLHPNTISPVTLMELGRYSQSGKIIVCCPEGYHRRGNVQYLCE
ncbi:hypothetical protein CC78DRAFT_592910 [Lojkania enalia]|uniref:Uncharacterized protein n=1 Tax=Lojkania enalia TaxID=147567 RepID=A0A9P4N576_9PLEO|nr:hypothetical protein CC78DRAFT_592910 [Didymosphaeria enalia]